MATQTEEIRKSDTQPKPFQVLESETTSAMHKKAVTGLLSEFETEGRQLIEDEKQSRFTRIARAITTAPEILILVVWIVMIYALWTQFRGPILALLK